MAAGPTKELETLLIRLAGDGSQYASMMKNAVAQTTQASAQITRQQQMIALHAAKAAISIQMAQEKAAISVQAAQQKAAISVERAQQRAAEATARSAARQQSAIDNTSKTLYQHAKAIDHAANRMMDMGRGMSFYVTAPIVAAGVAMTKMAADWERQEMVFSTLLGKEVGLPLLRNMQHLADVTPYVFKDISGAGSLLMGAGMDAGKILDTVRMLGDVAAGTGADLWSLSNVYTQIMNMGHLKGQDKLQLTSNRFPIKEIANTMGITMEQFPKMMEEGKISFAIVEQTFKRLTSEGGRFNNLMDKLAGTTVGVFSTFLDMIQKTGREFGKVLLPPANDLLGVLSDMLVSLQQLTPEAQKYVSVFAGGLATIGPVLFGLGLVLKPLAVFVSVLGGSLTAVITSPAWMSVLLVIESIYFVLKGIDYYTGGKLVDGLKNAAQWAGLLKDDLTLAKEASDGLFQPEFDFSTNKENTPFVDAIKEVVFGIKDTEHIKQVTESFEKLFETVDTKGVAALKKYQEGVAVVDAAVKAGIITDERKLEVLNELAKAYEEAVPNEYMKAYDESLKAYEDLKKEMDISPLQQEFNAKKDVLYDAWMKGIIGAEEYSNRVNAIWTNLTGQTPDIAGWLSLGNQKQGAITYSNAYSGNQNKPMTANDYSRMMGYGMLGQPEPYFDPAMMMPEQRVKRDEAGETSAGGLWGLMQSAGATQKTVEEEMSDKITRTNELLQMLYEKSGSSW